MRQSLTTCGTFDEKEVINSKLLDTYITTIENVQIV